MYLSRSCGGIDKYSHSLHNKNMKSEKVCISKKNLIISLIVIFLLGVVGVSYMVQRNLTTRSKASEMNTIYANCRLAFEEIVKPLFGGGYLPQNVVTFEDNYVDNSTSNNLVSCASEQKYVYATSNNDWKAVPGKCCLNAKSKSDGKPVEEGLVSIGLSYVAGVGVDESSTPFKRISEDRNAKMNSGDSMLQEPKTCINYGAPEGSKERDPQACDTGNINEEECGPNGEKRRYFKVGCGAVGKDGNTSCDFSCFNGVDWNNVCRKADGTENPNVCLVPSPTPTESPAANTFNSTNQTSNQTVVEVNINCSTNLKQMDGTMLKSDYYTCYTATELNNVTSVDNDGKILPAPTQSTVYPKRDNLPRRISTFYGQNKNEPCKKLVGNTLTNGVCASTK